MPQSSVTHYERLYDNACRNTIPVGGDVGRFEGGYAAGVRETATTASPGPIQTRSHDGYEWIYVLRGRARVILGDRDRDGDLVVEAGQAVEFDARIPHGVRAARGGLPQRAGPG